MPDCSADNHVLREMDSKADALRKRQLQDQQTLIRLQSRADAPGQPIPRGQVIGKNPAPYVQRIPVKQPIVQNPPLMRQTIMTQAPVSPIQRSVPVTPKPSVQKIHAPPVTNIITGMPIKKWPTSFKKALHKSTPDERIMSGVNNLDHMSRKLLGR